MSFQIAVPASRIYVVRTDEGEGVMGEGRDLVTPFKDRPSTFIVDRLRKRIGLKAVVLAPQPKPRPKRVRPRRLYIPVNEEGSSVQQVVFDKHTGHVLARIWGSHFHAWTEAILMAKSQGLTDKDVFVRQEL